MFGLQGVDEVDADCAGVADSFVLVLADGAGAVCCAGALGSLTVFCGSTVIVCLTSDVGVRKSTLPI